jgi:pyruvate kinase
MQVMLDTVGPELQVVNKSEVTISLEENESVVLTPHQGQEASSKLLPINFSGLAKVKPLILYLCQSCTVCVCL